MIVRPAIKRVAIAAVTTAVVLVGVQVVEATTFGWEVNSPDDIRVLRGSGVVGLYSAIADYDSTSELTMGYGVYENNKTTINVVKGDYSNLFGKKIAIAVPYIKTIFGDWFECIDPKTAALTGMCWLDNSIDYGIIYINTASPGYQRWAPVSHWPQRLAAHEIGHIVGLAHPGHPFPSCAEDSIMEQTKCIGATTNPFDHELTTYDKDDISDIY